MKPYRILVLLAACGGWLCLGAKVAPFYAQCALLDRVLEATKLESPARYKALEILERVATRRMDAAAPDLEEQVGLGAGLLHGEATRYPEVRAHALRNIGKVALPEALEFLRNVKEGDVGADDSSEIWSAVQIARDEALLIRIPDESAKTEFLEKTLHEWSAASHWAIDELCNRGSSRSMPAVRQQIHELAGLQARAEEEAAFCEARMDVINRNPDRAKALGSVLSVTAGDSDRDQLLIGWAIGQLDAMKSDAADAELRRYQREIQKLPREAREGHWVWHADMDIQRLLSQRPKK